MRGLTADILIMSKSIFKSKTAALALVTTLAGIAAQFSPPVAEFMESNVETVLVILGGVNLLLRRLTSEQITLFPLSK